MRSTRLLTSLLLVAAMVLSGCATIPTSGPIVTEPRRSGPQGPGGVAINPEPPQTGASPTLVIDGFLHAMAAYEPGYMAARQYLTGPAKDSWDAAAGVTVYSDAAAPKVTAESVTMEAPLVGTLGPDGAFVAAGEKLFVHDFGLVKDDAGQWRISKPPPGILISRYLFATTYTRTDVFFTDADRTTLVPDSRYVARGNRTTTGALQMLLAGPSPWLAPAVTSAVPAGTSLSSPVTVTNGTVTISLSAVPQGAELAALGAQIAATLRQLPDLTAFKILARGVAVDMPDQLADGTVPLTAADRFDPLTTLTTQLFAMNGSRLFRVGEVGSSSRPVSGDFGSKDWDARSVGISADGLEAALVVGDQLIRGPVDGTGAKVVLTKANLVRPQFSRTSGLWAMTSDGHVFRAEGDQVAEVPAPGLQGRSVVAFRISPDGQRMAVVTESAGVREVGLLRIVRKPTVSLAAWKDVPLILDHTPLTGALDVGWTSQSTLSVLVGLGRPAEVVEVDEDGIQLREIGRADNWSAVSLAVTPRNVTRKAVGDDEGGVWLYQDAYRWLRVGETLRAPTYPG